MKAARGMEVLSIFSVSCWRVLMLPHYVIKCLWVCGVMRFEFSVLLFPPPPRCGIILQGCSSCVLPVLYLLFLSLSVPVCPKCGFLGGLCGRPRTSACVILSTKLFVFVGVSRGSTLHRVGVCRWVHTYVTS